MKNYRRFLSVALCAFFYLLVANRLKAAAAVDTLPPLKDADEATLVQLVEQRLGIALGVQERFRTQAENSKNEAIECFRRFNTAKQDTSLPKTRLRALQQDLDAAQKTRVQWQKRLAKADETVNAIEVVSRMKPAEMRKAIPRIDKQTEALAALESSARPAEVRPIAEVPGTTGVVGPEAVSPTPPDTTTAAKPTKKDKPRRDKYGETAEKTEKVEKTPRAAADTTANKPPKNKKPPKATPPTVPQVVYASYNPAKDVMLAPPVPPCALGQERRDEFSGEVYREVRRTELFRHSTEAMLKFLKGRPHIVCEAALATGTAAVWLNLTFTITDPNAPRAFGSLPKGGLAVLKFIDGTTVNAYNQRADEGTPDPNNSEVRVFRGQFLLDRTLLRKLQKTELDKIRIAWGTGYEDYPVYRVDVLQHQADCLLK